MLMAHTAAPSLSEGRRLGVEDWVNAAVTCMLASSVDGVRIERLAKDLGVTKGSFYWHFRDRDALLDAVLARWEQITLQFNQLLNTEERDPARRLLRFLGLADEIEAAVPPGDFDAAIRGWARRSAEVRQVVERVDRLREQNAMRMFQELGVAGERARALGRIGMAIGGRLWAGRPYTAAQRRQMVLEAHAMLMSAVDHEPG
jgi:AcrR family transcriptional regulator